jgi:hypothetical protein
MLVTVTLNMVYTLTVLMKPIQEKRSMLCPDCGGEMMCLGFVGASLVPHGGLDSS